MAPSSLTFTPNAVTFDSEPGKKVNFASSDGILQTQDLEEANIYLNGILVPYDGETANIDGSYFNFNSNPNGEVEFNAWQDADGSQSTDYEGTLNVTKIIFDGKEYLPQ